MIEFQAKINDSQPNKFKKQNNKTVNLVPYLFLIIPDNTQEIAAPNGIADTATENSRSLTAKALLESKIRGPAGADHPKDIPFIIEPPFAEKLDD